jgi:hypothetical protein
MMAMRCWATRERLLLSAVFFPPDIVFGLTRPRAGRFVPAFGKGRANERFLANSAYFRAGSGTLRPIWGDEDMVLLRY